VVTQDGTPELADDARAGFDTKVASPARIWDYWLGGKDNFASDREAARKVIEIMPSMPLIARSTRRFLVSAVHELAAERGIRQFLDLGTGLPTADNTHEVAHRAAPQSRVVYVDNDPMVLVHARALLTGAPGLTNYIQADVRDTKKILAGAAGMLDFSQPVAVMLIAVLHFISDADDPYRIVTDLMDAVPSGSYLVMGHGTNDILPGTAAEMNERYNQFSAVPLHLRPREQIMRFYDGLELVPPGLAPLSHWAPGSAGTGDTPAEPVAPGIVLSGYCGMAVKP
jgi:hypothetical protein